MTSTFGKDNPITNNAHMLKWVDRIAKIARPSSVIWITGDPDQLDSLRQEGFELGILEKLNEEKLPGCVLHRSNPNDVARVEDRTFICTRKEEDAGPTNNWMEPKEMYAKLRHSGRCHGRTGNVYCPIFHGRGRIPLCQVRR